jgi:hypothetical protein
MMGTETRFISVKVLCLVMWSARQIVTYDVPSCSTCIFLVSCNHEAVFFV